MPGLLFFVNPLLLLIDSLGEQNRQQVVLEPVVKIAVLVLLSKMCFAKKHHTFFFVLHLSTSRMLLQACSLVNKVEFVL